MLIKREISAMTEVNGIGPCSSLAFVGGTDKHGVGVEMRNETSAGKGQGNPGRLQRMRRKVSMKRSAISRSFLLIERLILLMMGL